MKTDGPRNAHAAGRAACRGRWNRSAWRQPEKDRQTGTAGTLALAPVEPIGFIQDRQGPQLEEKNAPPHAPKRRPSISDFGTASALQEDDRCMPFL